MGALIDDPFDSQPLEEIISPARACSSSSRTRRVRRRRSGRQPARAPAVALGVAPSDLRIIFATGIPIRHGGREDRAADALHHAARPHARPRRGRRTTARQPRHDRRGTPIEINRAARRTLARHPHRRGQLPLLRVASPRAQSICPASPRRAPSSATHHSSLRLRDGRAPAGRPARAASTATPSTRMRARRGRDRALVSHQHGRGRARPRRPTLRGRLARGAALACAEFADTHAVPVEEKRPLVVASCGGILTTSRHPGAQDARHGGVCLRRGRLNRPRRGVRGRHGPRATFYGGSTAPTRARSRIDCATLTPSTANTRGRC